MGASESVVDAADFLTKDEAMALAGADQWDEAQWEAAEKDDQGRVKAELVLLAAAQLAAADKEEEAAPAPAAVVNDDAAAVTAAIEAAKAADKESAATAPARVAERLAKAVEAADGGDDALQKAEWLGKVSEEPADEVDGDVPGEDNLEDLPEALRADRDFMLAAAAKSTNGHALHFASHALKADGDFLRAARQALADKHLALPEEQRAMEQFKSCASLNAALANDSTALLRAEWLIKLAEDEEEQEKLGHRGELPEEAFYEGPVWQFVEYPFFHGVVVVALSYMWATADHPDPTGEQLRDVAKFLKWLQTTDDYENCTIVVFWDWASLYQDKPHGSRAARKTALFKLGLMNVNLWYCHIWTFTLMNQMKPEGRVFGYTESGWTVSRV